MSAAVEKCLSELAKLREKVRPRLLRKPALPKAKEAEVEKGREAAAATAQGTKVVHSESAMSESTIFLLMDRFAPC